MVEYLRGGNSELACSTASEIFTKDPNIDVNELIDGQTILHHACHHGQWELIEVILDRPNVNVNIRDSCNSRTPLHIAAIKGIQKPLKQLLDTAEIDLRAKDADGYLPVHYAATHPMQAIQSWHFGVAEDYTHDILLRLCAQGAVKARTAQGRGPLHLAAETGHIAAVKVFLTHPDLDINMRDSHGDTALHLSESTGVAGTLLGKGLDANVQNIDGNTALHCALRQRQTELVPLLMKYTRLDSTMSNKKGEHLMHIAAAKWDLVTFELVAATSLRRDINIPDGNGETVLHIAARSDNTEIVEHLLSIPGIAVNAKDKMGRTSLHLACEDGHTDTAKMLLIDAPNIHVNARDETHRTPLHRACEKEQLDVVHCLLTNAKVDADALDQKGCTPLHLASRLASGEPIVRALLRATKDIDNQVPDTRATALHLAAHGGHFKTVQSLLEHGASPRITCNGLISPCGAIGLDAAGVADKIEIIDLIRHYRWRTVTLVANSLNQSQETLLNSLNSYAIGVHTFWKWPRAEGLPEKHGKTSRPRRQKIYPDISPVYRIYGRLTSKSRQVHEPCEEEQWQLGHREEYPDLWTGKGSKTYTEYHRQRTTKWVHFSAQNVSIINNTYPYGIITHCIRRKG